MGPAIVWLFQGLVGVLGIMVIYAAMYIASAILTGFLTLPGGDAAQWQDEGARR